MLEEKKHDRAYKKRQHAFASNRKKNGPFLSLASLTIDPCGWPASVGARRDRAALGDVCLRV